MKKIAIKTDRPEADNMLIIYIKMLFPECEHTDAACDEKL